jgi:hypothetical protein
MAFLASRSQSAAIMTKLHNQKSARMNSTPHQNQHPSPSPNPNPPKSLPNNHEHHQKRRRREISARHNPADVAVLLLAAESRRADQKRETHGNQAKGRESVACDDARGDEQAESWDHGDDGDDADSFVAADGVGVWGSGHCG